MRLNQLSGPTARRLLLDDILPPSLLFEGAQPRWPIEWSDRLFVPRRDFTERRTARKFLRWLKEHGVPVDDWIEQIEEQGEMTLPPPKSAAGGVGRAYFLGDYVVKITSDEKEADLASHVAGKSIPFLTRIISVITLDAYEYNIYAILQDRVPYSPSGQIRTAATAVYDYLDQRGPRPLGDVEQAAADVVALLPPKHANKTAVRMYVYKILAAIDSVYRQTGVLLLDPHGGNVGLSGKELSFFDLGRSKLLNRS